MEPMLFSNLGVFHTDFIVLCGDSEVWNAQEDAGVYVDLTPYEGRELMAYRKSSKKYQTLVELRKAYKNATDKTAQFFIKTPLPLINVTINGHEIHGLVDTGAQLSIITKAAAKQLSIFGQLDTRFQVDAQGVGGMNKALGKILDVELNFSGYFMPVVLTVFEESSLGFELVIGVDILTAYNGCVDLKNKCVRFNEEVEIEIINNEE